MFKDIHNQYKIVGSTGNTYTLTHYDQWHWHCSCPGFEARGYCKHKRRYFNEGITDHASATPEPKKDRYSDEDFLYIFKHCSLKEWRALKDLSTETGYKYLSWYGENDEKIAEAIQRPRRGIKVAVHKLVNDVERFKSILSKATNIEDIKNEERLLVRKQNLRRRKILEERNKTPQERKAAKQVVKNKQKLQKEKSYRSGLGTTYWSILHELDSSGDMKYHVKIGKTKGNHPSTRTMNWGPLVCFIELECEHLAHEMARKKIGKVTLAIKRQGGNECFGAFDSAQEAQKVCYKLGNKVAKKLKLELQDYKKDLTMNA